MLSYRTRGNLIEEKKVQIILNISDSKNSKLHQTYKSKKLKKVMDSSKFCKQVCVTSVYGNLPSHKI